VNILYYLELKAIAQKNIEVIVPELKTGRPLSPMSDNCGACSNNVAKKGNNLFKSISFCTIKNETKINFIKTKGLRNTNFINSRIYVTATHKLSTNCTKTSAPSSSSASVGLMTGVLGNDILGDASSLLNTSFEEDNEGSFLPMLSPADNLFQNSPQTELSKILSPQSSMNSPHTGTSMPSLSPFQPIQNKQQYMTTPVKNASGQDQEVCDCLSEGYMVAVYTEKTLPNHQRRPAIIKVKFI